MPKILKILIGDPGHPEVRAIVGSADGKVIVDWARDAEQLEVKPEVLAHPGLAQFNLCCSFIGKARELRICIQFVHHRKEWQPPLSWQKVRDDCIGGKIVPIQGG